MGQFRPCRNGTVKPPEPACARCHRESASVFTPVQGRSPRYTEPPTPRSAPSAMSDAASPSGSSTSSPTAARGCQTTADCVRSGAVAGFQPGLLQHLPRAASAAVSPGSMRPPGRAWNSRSPSRCRTRRTRPASSTTTARALTRGSVKRESTLDFVVHVRSSGQRMGRHPRAGPGDLGGPNSGWNGNEKVRFWSDFCVRLLGVGGVGVQAAATKGSDSAGLMCSAARAEESRLRAGSDKGVAAFPGTGQRPPGRSMAEVRSTDWHSLCLRRRVVGGAGAGDRYSSMDNSLVWAMTLPWRCVTIELRTRKRKQVEYSRTGKGANPRWPPAALSRRLPDCHLLPFSARPIAVPGASPPVHP